MKWLLRRWPFVFLAQVPLLVLWPAVFGGQAIGPWDHIQSMGPWYGPKPQTPWDVLQADGVLQFAPWRSLVFDSWSKGQIPAWNNYQLMGTPLLANSQSAGFYPLHILVGLLHIPLYPAMTFLAWFHLSWAGLGVYLLVRRMGGTKTGGAVAGASFALSAFMVYWTALPSVIMTVSWIPWALACTLAFFQTDSFWGITYKARFSPTPASPSSALREAMFGFRSHRGWVAGLMASVAMMALAGHLQFLAFGLLAVAVAGVVMAIRLIYQRVEGPVSAIRKSGNSGPGTEEGVRHVVFTAGFQTMLRFAFAIVVGLCIAALQLAPVLAFSKQSHRRGTPTAEGYAAYTASAIKAFEWVGLEFPKMVGDPAESAGDPQNHSLFWAALAKRGDSFGESAMGLGPLILLLLCCLPKIGWKRGLPIALVGLLGILIACGTPFDWLLYFGVPGWSSTGSPGRAVVLFVIAACCLAGLAIQPSDAPNLTRKARGLVLFVFLTVALTVASVIGLDRIESFIPGLDSLPAMIHQARTIDAPMFLVATLLALGAGIAWISRNGRSRILLLIAAPIVPLLLTSGVLRFGTPIKPVGAPASYYRFAYLNDGWNLFVTPRATMPPNMATLLRIHDLGGYDSLLDHDTKALLDEANRQDSSPAENGNMMLVKQSADIDKLGDLGVSLLEVPQQHVNLTGSRVSVDNGHPELPVTEYPQITAEDYRSIKISAIGPGKLTLRDRNMSGWTAKIDGKATPIAPGLFRKIDLAAGTHEVEFDYWPPGMSVGFALFALGMLPLLGNILAWRGAGGARTRN